VEEWKKRKKRSIGSLEERKKKFNLKINLWKKNCKEKKINI